ncbi:MAG: DUF4349 domain-containing protein [Planctomycetota bacterium]|nr:DUF4349 domain-containing protein [Planctomycetota bacterium]
MDRAAADREAAVRVPRRGSIPVLSNKLDLEAPGNTQDEESSPARLVADHSVDPATPQGKRIVIYNAGLRIVVKEIDKAIKRAEAFAAEFGGYVQEIRSESITIRIPVAHYREAVSRMEDLGRVVARQLDAADVTEEYVDLEARLKNAKAVRERLRALLDRAEDVKAALEVEKELKRVGEEIERLLAKLKLINNRVAYSTILASFERVYRTPPTQQIMKLPFLWLRELDPQRLARNDW